MRPVVALAVLASPALALGLVGSSSCVLASRTADGGMDVVEPPEGSAGVEAGTEAGVDADFDCGCCSTALLPGLPTCSGKIAIEIPALDCALPCSGKVAYAVCSTHGCYASCSCDLPHGYTLEDGGIPLPAPDAGAGEAASSDASDGALDGP